MKILIPSLFCIFCSILLQAQDVYIAKDLTAEKQFTTNCEGPAVDKFGNLYAVNYQHDGTICIIKPGEQPELFVTLPEGSVGNGIRFNKKGEMFVADFKKHNVLKVNTATREVSVYAHNNLMNQPNDLAVSNAGIIFLSDPNWNNQTGNIWRVSLEGETTLLESGMNTTNGIEVSPDDKLLYVNESMSRKIWVYDLDKKGNISNKRLFYSFDDYGLDGMRCDAEGNLYVTRYDKGCVVILSKKGEIIKEVFTKGKKTSNVTFGGPQNKTIFVTLQDRGCIEYFENTIAGAR